MQNMEEDPVLAAAEAFGIDLSLLRESLKLTPTERIRQNEGALKFFKAVRAAGEKKYGPFPPLNPGSFQTEC